VLLVILALVVVLQACAWRELSARVTSGALTSAGAVGRYLVWAVMPTVLFVTAFLSAVGLEEWLGVALIGESMARATLPLGVFLIGVAGLGTLCFGVRCAWLKVASAKRG
jgi:hypothetical protein